jgi:hypothetical protein
MWYGAKEYAEGKFHEPYFFGQPYNTMLESLASVPLLSCGASYPVALTCTMSLFTLIPFILISIILFRRKKNIQSFIVLSIPLLLPNEYGMITAISRGCVTGSFIATFAILTIYFENKFRFLLFGLFSVLALWATSNSIVVLFPVGVWLLAENFRDKNFYLLTFFGAIPSALIWYFANRFYVIHPEYIIHNSWPLDFSLGRIKPHNWNDLFNYVTPIFWRVGCLIFPILVSVGIVLLRQKEKQAAIGVFSGALFLFFTLTINKVHDGYPTVFYSWGRMFLAIPLLLAVFLGRLHFPKLTFRTLCTFLLIPILCFTIKSSTIAKDVHREIVEKSEHNMYVSDISHLQLLCDTISEVSKKYKIDLIAVGYHHTKHLINYGCPCLRNDFPPTFEPIDDRRTWLLKELDSKIPKTILFAGINEDAFATQMKLNAGIMKVSNDPLLYILEGNSITTKVLLESLQMPMRLH